MVRCGNPLAPCQGVRGRSDGSKKKPGKAGLGVGIYRFGLEEGDGVDGASALFALTEFEEAALGVAELAASVFLHLRPKAAFLLGVGETVSPEADEVLENLEGAGFFDDLVGGDHALFFVGSVWDGVG